MPITSAGWIVRFHPFFWWAGRCFLGRIDRHVADRGKARVVCDMTSLIEQAARRLEQLRRAGAVVPESLSAGKSPSVAEALTVKPVRNQSRLARSQASFRRLNR